MTGLIGFGGAYEAMEHCDLLILLGTDMPYSAWYPRNRASSNSTSGGEHLGGRTRIDLGVVGTWPRPCVPCSPSWNPGMTAGILTRPCQSQEIPGTPQRLRRACFLRRQAASRASYVGHRRQRLRRNRLHRGYRPPTTSGAARYITAKVGGTSSARSTTAPWPAPCPCPSARNCSIPNGRSSRSAATAA